jgi:formylglycine-generating enzyme required for sulfatase activity
MARRLLAMILLSILVVLFCGCGKDKQARDAPGEVDEVRAITRKDGAEMVFIPAGEFEMGTDESKIPQLVLWAKKWSNKDTEADWFEDETPCHTVYLDSFYMDKYEVTNAQYARFLNEYGKNTDAAGHTLLRIGDRFCLIEKKWNAYRPKSGYDNHPVTTVSWYGAAAYAQFYGKRLPTEAQWEKAARGGLVRKRFPWGDDDPDGTQCNFADKNTFQMLPNPPFPLSSWSNKNVDDGYGQTAPVGSYPPYGYGLHDMAGNVWEWCADENDPDYYRGSPKDNPMGARGDHNV